MSETSAMSNLQKKTRVHVIGSFIKSLPVRGMLLLLYIYQIVFSPLKQFFFGPSCGCRFQPTCSCYAYDAFMHFGFWKGLWFTLKRLLRCHPWHAGGFDPLPGVNRSK